MRRDDLIVPIKDRRRHRRVMTLRNAGFASLALLIVFLAISIRSEMRGTSGRSYGRIIDRALPEGVPQKKLEVVEETPAEIEDQTSPDPLLLPPMAREQWLYGETAPPAVPASTVAPAQAGKGDVTIVGGPEGITIVRRERPRPVLSGGFGKAREE